MAERYERARGLFEHGEYQAAAEALRALVDESALEPPLHGTTELRLLLARSYFHSAQLQRAEPVTRAILADHPDEAYANLVLGRTLQRMGRHAEAKPHLAMAKLLGAMPGRVGFRATTTPADDPLRPRGRVRTVSQGAAGLERCGSSWVLLALGLGPRVGDVEVVDPLAVFDEVAGAFDRRAVC